MIMDFEYYNELTKRQKLLLKGATPLNLIFKKLKLNIEIVPRAENNHMISLEQRINLFHLLSGVLAHNVEGDVIELGCHVGNTTTQMQSILEKANSKKNFHVYDKFDSWPGFEGNVVDILKQNFILNNLGLPFIHEGDFRLTLPDQLPDRLAFVHMDTGHGQSTEEHKNLMLFLLDHVYHRMANNAVCLIMDFHDPNKTVKGDNSLKGIKQACDTFFENKPEKMSVLYGNQFSHGYFRKY